MKRSLVFVAAPHEQDGGGMGRVKDYIVQSDPGFWQGLRPVPLITRDHRGKWWSPFLVVKACIKILHERVAGRLALVHVNMGDRGSAARKGVLVLWCRLLGVRVFLHFHAVTFERDLERLPRTMRRLTLLPFRVATCDIVLGERWRRWLVDEIGVRRPIEVLINGVPIEAPDARRHVDPGAGAFNILFLGNLIERKGVSDLIAALALLPETGPRWQAKFAGNGDAAHYTKVAERAGIADKIAFTGWISQHTARALVSAADLLVLPSHAEGLPLVVLEALGLGTPIITTPVGAIPEVLTDGKDVIFCPPGDPPALALAISRLTSDLPLRQSLCDNGLKTFQECFSADAFRRNLLAIWKRYALDDRETAGDRNRLAVKPPLPGGLAGRASAGDPPRSSRAAPED